LLLLFLLLFSYYNCFNFVVIMNYISPTKQKLFYVKKKRKEEVCSQYNNKKEYF
jgi:hypothetical protein